MLEKGNFVYNYWGCKSVYSPLSYPYKYYNIRLFRQGEINDSYKIICSESKYTRYQSQNTQKTEFIHSLKRTDRRTR